VATRIWPVLVDKALKVYEKIDSDKKMTGLAMASLRNPGEVDRVHELDGIVLWLDADPRVRYERIQANLLSRGAQRLVDDQKTFEQFQAEETAEMRHSGDAATLSLSDVKARADLQLLNNSLDMEAFSRDIDQLFKSKN